MTYAGAAFLREMKESAKDNTVGWQALSPITRWIAKHPPVKGAKSINMTKNRLLSMWAAITKAQPWGKLINALAFQLIGHDHDVLTSKFGIIPGFAKNGKPISPQAAKYANALTKGFTKPVDPRMKKYLAAIGVPVRKTTTELKTPERPLVLPVWERFKGRFVELFQTKFLQKVFNGWNSTVIETGVERDAA